MRPLGRGALARAVLLRAALLALAILLFSSPLAAAPVVRRAILVRGADSVKGLPFFAPNAIAALSGRYSLDGATSPGRAEGLAVWYSRESLVFSSAWKRLDRSEASSYADAAYSLERDGRSVLALKFEGYVLFLELSGDSREAAFARAFSAKFSIYFRSAASDAELSFPAYVDY
jgi:hypothetical protein